MAGTATSCSKTERNVNAMAEEWAAEKMNEAKSRRDQRTGRCKMGTNTEENDGDWEACRWCSKVKWLVKRRQVGFVGQAVGE